MAGLVILYTGSLWSASLPRPIILKIGERRERYFWEAETGDKEFSSAYGIYKW